MKSHKQTAIWLFSASIPLTRIQLWQIPGAANTIRQKWVCVMIKWEGQLLSLAAPASQPRGLLWLERSCGSTSPEAPLPQQANQVLNTTGHKKYSPNTKLDHAIGVLSPQTVPHGVQYYTQLAAQIVWTVLMVLVSPGNPPVAVWAPNNFQHACFRSPEGQNSF